MNCYIIQLFVYLGSLAGKVFRAFVCVCWGGRRGEEGEPYVSRPSLKFSGLEGFSYTLHKYEFVNILLVMERRF